MQAAQGLRRNAMTAFWTKLAFAATSLARRSPWHRPTCTSLWFGRPRTCPDNQHLSRSSQFVLPLLTKYPNRDCTHAARAQSRHSQTTGEKISQQPPAPCPETTWRVHAACRSLGDYYFFPPHHESDRDRVRRERAAKAICAMCPVLSPCRELALKWDEPHGVWGGLSESDRWYELHGDDA